LRLRVLVNNIHALSAAEVWANGEVFRWRASLGFGH
jgi:hypothetical protein